MAIVVLVLWMFTAGAGSRLLLSSSLGRARPADSPVPGPPVPGPPVPSPAVPSPAVPTPNVSGGPARGPQPAPAAAAHGSRRAARDRWAPPSLVAARQAPVLPAGRSLIEFAHPTAGIVGLGFWLGFTLVHNRALGWIGFGLAAVTACVGLGWFTANARAARRAGPSRRDGPAPSFAGRLVALHGSAAAVTIALAALAALVFRG